MKWFKHITDSLDDPFIFDLVSHFKGDGYMVFFGTLEIMSREFNIETPGICEISLKFLAKKLQLSVRFITKVLDFCAKNERIFYSIKNDRITLNCPKLIKMCDEFTQKALKEKSGVDPDTVGSESGIRNKKKEEDKEKEGKEYPPRHKYLDSVLLSDEEYKKLQEVLGQKNLDCGIEQLDYSITVKGGKYKDHYKTLLNWFKRGFLKVNGEQAAQRQRPERLPTQEEELRMFNERWAVEHKAGAE